MRRMKLSRRSMLGYIALGAGVLLTGCGLNSRGERMKRKARVLLAGMPSAPPGLEDAVNFPLIDALHGRRARRFSLGASIPDGPLAFASQQPPMPLDELEQMMVLAAVAGNTGWFYLHPYNKHYAPNVPNYAVGAAGRTFPSAAGFHTSEIFYTDDNGTYFFPTRDSGSLMERDGEGAVDLASYLAKHRARIKKLSNTRLHIPDNPAHIDQHNPWCVNRPGSTLIIPVADLAQHYLAALCYIVQNGACMFDDVHGEKIPGMERFANLVDVNNPYPLTYLEQLCLAEVTAETSTACYAGMLMLQATGLGGWMFDGLTPFSVLGASGDPAMPGLGFRFDTNPRWSIPNATGLPGVFEGFCPPHYPDMRAATEAVVQRKFGPGGPFNAQTAGPYKENARVRGAGKVHDDAFKDCVATMAQYVFDRFGKFPGTVPSMFVLTYLQAHHLDLEFYDRHFAPGAYLDTHARHMEQWHPKKV